mgnify:CR=1 FL=1|jgi:hypothetical protein
MDDILDLLTSQMNADSINQMARQVGASPDAVGTAVSGALPALVGALSRNAAEPQGAMALAGALDRDHDGSILDNIGGFLGAGDTSPGAAILGHVLGGRQGNVERGLASKSGLDAGQITQILAMLAPLVMGALGRQKQQGGLDLGGLTDMLSGQRRRMEKDQGMGGLLGSLLDSDGDGDSMDDLAKIGGGLLGKILG